MRRTILPLLLLAALLVPAAAALPSEKVQTFEREGHPEQTVAAVWVGPTNESQNISLAPGASTKLWFALHSVNATNGSIESMSVTVSSPALNLSETTFTMLLQVGTETWKEKGVDITIPGNASGQLAYSWVMNVNVTENGTTTLLTSRNCTCFVYAESATVAPQPAAPGTGAPWPLIIGALVVLGAGGGAFVYRSRQRRLMNAAPRRSQVMREMALEKELEKAKAKDPERAQEIKQEIRQQEQVREKRRELQILEAKRADVLKSIELLKKRHELGALSKLQLDTMTAKKNAELAKVEADIAQMEAEDARDPSAAA